MQVSCNDDGLAWALLRIVRDCYNPSMSNTIIRLGPRHRRLILDHVNNPRTSSHDLSIRHGYHPVHVRRILASVTGKAYARVLEDRLITESIRAAAIIPAMLVFQDAVKIDVPIPDNDE
jgi:hypothetical protein